MMASCSTRLLEFTIQFFPTSAPLFTRAWCMTIVPSSTAAYWDTCANGEMIVGIVTCKLFR